MVRNLDGDDVVETLAVEVAREEVLMLEEDGEDVAELCNRLPGDVPAEEVEVDEDEVTLVLVAEELERVDDNLRVLPTRVDDVDGGRELDDGLLVAGEVVGARTRGGPKGHADGLMCIAQQVL